MNNNKTNTLYRKYRPSSFDEILGQNEVVNILRKSIQDKNITHSYIFSGDRGTGKTSTARIFAKEIGCAPEDIYEMDGASNRGISEIREIRDTVDILPMSSPYKVYIIDEVHMLTKDAFNALLKTLEEPPRHIIFILATTEKDRILPTIISRCQVYDFKNPDISVLNQMIKDVVEKEGREVENDVVELISQKGNGSFRDTLSVLQKVLTVIEGVVTTDKISDIFGENFSDLEDIFLKNLIENNKDGVFKVYLELQENNFNIDTFLNNIIEKVRTLLLIKISDDFKHSISNEAILKLDVNSGHLKKLLDIEKYLNYSTNKNISFELFLFDLFDTN